MIRDNNFVVRNNRISFPLTFWGTEYAPQNQMKLGQDVPEWYGDTF